MEVDLEIPTDRDLDLFFIKRTAIHESGHAIMCLYYDFYFKFISIEPGLSQDKMGFVRRSINMIEHQQLIRSKEIYLRANCIYSLAGIICEYKMGFKEDIDDLTEYLLDCFFEPSFSDNLPDVNFAYDMIVAHFRSKFPNTKVFRSRISNYIKKIINETILQFTDINGKDTELWNYVLLLSEELLNKYTLSYKEVCELIPNLKVHKDF